MDTNNFNGQKKQLAELLLPLCPFIGINGLHAEVKVPEALRRVDLVLRIGTNPRVMGMPDLAIRNTGWSATISIQGKRYMVFVPWEACQRMWVSEPFQGPLVVWPMPEILKQPTQDTPTKRERPSLKVVK